MLVARTGLISIPPRRVYKQPTIKCSGLKLSSKRIASDNVHGTGCTLSSAIAAHLALGQPLTQAVKMAREYILGAIEAGAHVKTGEGHGPLNHGYAPKTMYKI